MSSILHQVDFLPFILANPACFLCSSIANCISCIDGPKCQTCATGYYKNTSLCKIYLIEKYTLAANLAQIFLIVIHVLCLAVPLIALSVSLVFIIIDRKVVFFLIKATN